MQQPIQIAAIESGYRLFMKRKADKAFHAFATKIFLRDNHQCQFCGFSAAQHMEVINLDQNYRNNKASNLVTACPFCVQCHFIDVVGQGDFGGGTLVYLPEMSQSELNALCHVLFTTIALGSEQASDAKDHYRSIKTRSKLVEERLGEGMSKPYVYGQMLLDATQDVSSLHDTVCQSVRLLPNLKLFASCAKDWAASTILQMAEL